jgi:hypothetical protein
MSIIQSRTKTYSGIDHEEHHGMTMTGRIIRDAWVFGLLPEGDGFAGKHAGDLQRLFEAVHAAWEPYGQLAAKHARIHDEALQRAKGMGWDAELGEDD